MGPSGHLLIPSALEKGPQARICYSERSEESRGVKKMRPFSSFRVTEKNVFILFPSSRAWAIGPPVKHEKLVLTGGTAFPGCVRLTCFLDTGWKACATNLRDFSRQLLMGLRSTRKALKGWWGGPPCPPLVRSCIGGTGFQPVRRTGKMPVPPRTFWNSGRPYSKPDFMIQWQLPNPSSGR